VIHDDLLIDAVAHRLIRNFSESSDVCIPLDIKIIGSSCFSYCKIISAVSFEAPSHLIRIESSAFTSSSICSIVIPCSVEVIGASCFASCKSLTSVAFQANSRLIQIASFAFALSSLRSIELPANLRVIEDSAFRGVRLFSCSIEAGNETFVINDRALIDAVRQIVILSF
jgi:hypothetical protein